MSDILLSSTASQRIMTLAGPDHLLRIVDDDGNVVVEVTRDGTFTAADRYDADEAATRFWTALCYTVPGLYTSPAPPSA